MATYKVIQDVEAEDKLLGPLTLRQFVYAGITGVCIYLCYFVASKGVALLIPLFIPPAVVCAFFAFPWGKEQPTEIWALARIRFMFKPRKRVWNQSGIKELVTVNVPKRIEQIYTDGLSQTEVRSRLQALATTIDSRGWAIKNPTGGAFTTPAVTTVAGSDDRLIAMDAMQQPVETETYKDMLDPASNGVADKFDSMLHADAEERRAGLVAALQQPDPVPGSSTPPPDTQDNNNDNGQDAVRPDYWFLNENNQAAGSGLPGSRVVTPGAAIDPVPAAEVSPEEERNLVETLRNRAPGPAVEYSHLPTILPLSEQEKLAKQRAQTDDASAPPQQDAAAANDAPADAAATDNQSDQAASMTDQPDAAILELASNDDLDVATLARQAKRAHGEEDEVVISLH